MTEQQQYRVIADRDKGDDPQWSELQSGDRAVTVPHFTALMANPLVRIERPVPTTEETEDETQDLRTQVANLVPLSMIDGRDHRANVFEVADKIIPVVLASVHPSLPTREQIAEVLYRESSDWKLHRFPWSTVLNMADFVIRDGYFRRADAVLALLQKGADR